MYVRGYDDSNHDLLSYSDLYPDCPSSMTAAQCNELNHAPPSFADKPTGSPNITVHWNTTRVAPPAPHASAKPDVIAADITRFGQRNFIGVVVLAVLVFLGLVLWLAFGKWPKRKMAQLRERLAHRRERGYSITHAQSMEQVQVPELVRDQPAHAHLRSSTEYAKEFLDGVRGSEKVQRQPRAHLSHPGRMEIH
ncbi:hypothetical protein GSI_06724 [Ganoderma sinense ZZ0214-1]|uniref:Uncharacterized protein n=1 Tax=Ganoderma sinense ZZ0214-1 TaxID=1077348 RepID=A0A2G8SE23_9APHY|nr:hypothetical protein GSI_06724 [Ganoderma sinense ZZ0214-1]